VRFTPRKFDWLGTQRVEQVVSRSAAAAGEYGVTSERELALLALFSFLFGHRCIIDPLCPWILRTLT
jgi:hypothetical protein